ncbi:MAG: M23 family metallopeptidase [Candidatus Curtissbacteria bacterium]|nr:M23 family metallopeptidase [Candidatus Curtissbacteria bacterium]
MIKIKINEDHIASFEKSKNKFLRKIRRAKRSIKLLARMEAREAISLALAHTHFQLKIRPRIRMFSKIILVLAFAYVASDKALAYIKPHEADIKINGQAVLAAPAEPAGQSISEVQISQSVISRLSPFSFRKPVDSGYMSQGYTAYHRGNDIATALGTPIHPVGSGIVEFAGFTPDGRGNEVIVDHGDGLKTLYAHMGKIYVGVGNLVISSDTLGTVGLTGRTTGAHVHFEVYDHSIAVNPTSYLPQDN